MRSFFRRLRARLRTDGGTSATSTLGCVLLGALCLILVAVLCAVAQGAW